MDLFRGDLRIKARINFRKINLSPLSEKEIQPMTFTTRVSPPQMVQALAQLAALVGVAMVVAAADLRRITHAGSGPAVAGGAK
jgi:acetolactate synthase small subunit